ncbi:hypothetical protein BU16DRAFT_99136 [Lophium mytilinum]|uniref:Uncharacterized protein n=1 Tax=Lophium mytilinum TaxID=390894 RepID=A0A6A6QIQ0_9PEZI|nr:hypothetical protein BU16DRAFT_99136 [Lophium mytilinum]
MSNGLRGFWTFLLLNGPFSTFASPIVISLQPLWVTIVRSVGRYRQLLEVGDLESLIASCQGHAAARLATGSAPECFVCLEPHVNALRAACCATSCFIDTLAYQHEWPTSLSESSTAQKIKFLFPLLELL